jgi:hypothetical protein
MGLGQGVVLEKQQPTHFTAKTGAAHMKTTANNSPQEPQRLNAQEVIAANVKNLIEQLEQGRSETLTVYLNTMARFHSYSFGNVLSIARHRPDATHVAGFHSWIELGRHVTKGQKGIPILAPMIGGKRQRGDEADEQSDRPAPRLIGFRTVFVFDIAQTEGAALPEPATVTGEAGGYHDRLVEFIIAQGIELEYNERIAPAQGVSSGGRIVLLPGQTQAEEFATLAHELAHEMLHHGEHRASTGKKSRETEAEAVAYIVSRAVGLHTGTAAADYISLYDGNAQTLTESLGAIQQASAAILEAIFSSSAEQLAKAS